MDERQEVPAARSDDPAGSGRARVLGWGGVGIALALQSGILWVAQERGGEGAHLLAGTAVVSLGLAAVAWGFALAPRRRGATEVTARPAPPERGRVELTAIFDALPVGVFATDRDGQICLWSEGARAITGFGTKEVLGMPRGALFAAKAHPDETAGQTHCALRCKGGGWVVASVWAAPVVTSPAGQARRVEVFVVAGVRRPAPTFRVQEEPPKEVAGPEVAPACRPADVDVELLGSLGRVAVLARALGDGPLFPEEAAAARAILDEVSRLQRQLAPLGSGDGGEAPGEDPDDALRALVEGLDRL